MTWFETSTGVRAHKVPEGSNVTALCGVRADTWDPDHPEGFYRRRTRCESCQERMERILEGLDDEYEPWQVR